MISGMNPSVAIRLLLVLCAGNLGSCATGPETGVTRVKIYRLNPTDVPDAAEPSIPFEQKHYLFGAVSDAEREARRGNYYTVFFRTTDRTTPVRARFDYRQSSTGFKVYSQETEADPRGGVVRFAVAGEEFRQRGRLLGWRVTLTQGGRFLGERKSYLWD
jgi:hypothetical protein